MDIDLLSKMIGELILDHDELSLPGLGTFVAEEVPASFSDRGYTVNPPYRKLSFYQRPENDHLLIDFYARSNGVSFKDASLIIVRFLDEMKTLLKEKKVIVMPGLGRLRATRENNFFFVPDADLDIYPEGFGLRPVSMKNHTESQAELSSAVGKLSGMLFSEPAQEPVTEAISPAAEPSATSNPAPDNELSEPVVEVMPDEGQKKDEEEAVDEKKENEPAEESVVVIPEEVKDPVEEKNEEKDEEKNEEKKEEKKEEKNEEKKEEKNEEKKEGKNEEKNEGKNEEKKEEKEEEKKEEKNEGKKEEKNEGKKEEKNDRAEEDRKESAKGRTGLAAGLKVLIGIAALAAVALGVFLLLAHVAPELIDSLLYTPEELEILNYPLD